MQLHPKGLIRHEIKNYLKIQLVKQKTNLRDCPEFRGKGQNNENYESCKWDAWKS